MNPDTVSDNFKIMLLTLENQNLSCMDLFEVKLIGLENSKLV